MVPTVIQIADWYNRYLPQLAQSMDESSIIQQFREHFHFYIPFSDFFSEHQAEYSSFITYMLFKEDFIRRAADTEYSEYNPTFYSPLMMLVLFSHTIVIDEDHSSGPHSSENVTIPIHPRRQAILYMARLVDDTPSPDNPAAIRLPIWMEYIHRYALYSNLYVTRGREDNGWLHGSDAFQVLNLISNKEYCDLSNAESWMNYADVATLNLMSSDTITDRRKRHNYIVWTIARMLSYRPVWDISTRWLKDEQGAEYATNWEKQAALALMQFIIWARLNYHAKHEFKAPYAFSWSCEPEDGSAWIPVSRVWGNPSPGSNPAPVDRTYILRMSRLQDYLMQKSPGFPVYLGNGCLICAIWASVLTDMSGVTKPSDMTDFLSKTKLPNVVQVLSWGLLTVRSIQWIQQLNRPRSACIDLTSCGMVSVNNPEFESYRSRYWSPQIGQAIQVPDSYFRGTSAAALATNVFHYGFNNSDLVTPSTSAAYTELQKGKVFIRAIRHTIPDCAILFTGLFPFPETNVRDLEIPSTILS